MNNTAFSHLDDTGPVVALTNSLVSQFPLGRRLEFVHMPLAHGSIPPATDRRFYEPLRGLGLPNGTRFIAGLVHERQDIAEQRKVLDIVETEIGHRVDLAASCGLGRRDREAATQNLKRSRELAES